MAQRHTIISVGHGSLSLTESDITALVGALRDLNDRDANAVVEEIETMKLAGLRIDLRLSQDETGALTSAVTRILTTTPSGSQPRFGRLLTLVRDQSA
jgi:hypothetical protein